MVFPQIARDRFDRTLKSGLLCAAILMPASALAEPAGGPNGEPAQVAMATLPVINIDSGITDAKPAQPEPKPAQPEKAANLARHIQRKYRVPEHKATHIVREAFFNADRHQLEPELILAIIAVESTFKERAVSRVGARGLMQVMPGAHPGKIKEIGGRRALFDPAKNIHTGSRILVKYLDAHSGDLRRALLNYNGSLGTRSAFPDRVMRIYRDLKSATTVEG